MSNKKLHKENKQLVKEKLITLSSLVSLFCVAKKRIQQSTQKEISLNKGLSWCCKLSNEKGQSP